MTIEIINRSYHRETSRQITCRDAISIPTGAKILSFLL